MADFKFPLVFVGESDRSTTTDLLNRHPAMRAGIRPVGFDWSAKRTFNAKVNFVSMLGFHA